MKIALEGRESTKALGLRIRRSLFDVLENIAFETGTAPTTAARAILEKALADGIEIEKPKF